MGTDLKKVGRGNKAGIALCGLGAIGGIALIVKSFTVLGVLLLVGCIVGAVVFFKKLIVEYAKSGKRF